MCFFHWKFLSYKTSGNFIVLRFSILRLFIFNAGRRDEIIQKFCFSNIHSLFAKNHLFILINSLLTVLSNVLMLICLKSKLILSANIIGTSTFKELGRLFAYKITNGHSFELSGTPHLIFCFNVSAHSVIFRYCFLSLSNWKTKQDLWYWHHKFLVFLATMNYWWY